MTAGVPLLLFAAALALVLGAVWIARKFRGALDLDAQILEQLSAAGSDLSQPHAIELFLYFPDQAAAERAAQTLQKEGFEVRVEGGREEPKWLCQATRWMQPELAALQAIRRRLNRLAIELDGDYDGWGAEVIRVPGRNG